MQTLSQEPIIVSIRCTAYNHEKYIRDCLEGFIMQKTNFRFEAIVHDDASTDRTADIIREYATKYPDIIKPIYETENQYSKHDGSLSRIMTEACIGKYIAFCEGDDYWTDPLKLQKQVDFLETHPDIVYSCHRFKIFHEKKQTIENGWDIFFQKAENSNHDYFIFDRSYPFTKTWITLTLTQIVRRDVLDFSYMNKFKLGRDVHNIYHILSQGKGVCHSFVGGIYRINESSIFGGKEKTKKDYINYRLYKEFYEYEKDPMLKKIKFDFYYNYWKYSEANFKIKRDEITDLIYLLYHLFCIKLRKFFTC